MPRRSVCLHLFLLQAIRLTHFTFPLLMMHLGLFASISLLVQLDGLDSPTEIGRAGCIPAAIPRCLLLTGQIIIVILLISCAIHGCLLHRGPWHAPCSESCRGHLGRSLICDAALEISSRSHQLLYVLVLLKVLARIRPFLARLWLIHR